MKKLLILVMVLAMASLASATLKISVNGIVDPPDTQVVLTPSQHAVIDVTGDGQSPLFEYYLVADGPGTIAGGQMLYLGSLASIQTFVPGSGDGWEDVYKPWLESIGFIHANGLSYMVLNDGSGTPRPLDGKLVDLIDFHCVGPVDVMLTLFSVDSEGVVTVFDTQLIHQIPEPVTVALLGLGGLLLRRRIA